MKNKELVQVSVITLVKGHRVVARLLDKLSLIEKPVGTEIIVVDGKPGSMDDIKAKYPDIRWISYHTDKRYTIPEQRNLGITKSQSKIIAFIDADCIPEKKWLVNLIKPISDGGEDVATGQVKSLHKYPLRWSMESKRLDNKKYVNFAPTMNFAIKSEVAAKVGPYDETFEFGGEDTDYSLRLLLDGYKIRYVKSAVITHDWGTFGRNILRQYVYGKGRYFMLKKYKNQSPNKADVLLALGYPLYLISLPLAIIWPPYLFLLLIPLLKSFITEHSVFYAIENTIFCFTNALGLIVAFAIDVATRSGKLKATS